jgi:membrane protein YqaA with SNARE-associated domain
VIAAVALGRLAKLTAIGYPGVMILSFLGSAALVLPVPGLISLCGVSVVLNPLLLGILAGSAETLGEVSGYAIGYGGQHVLQKHRLYERVQGWMVRRGALVIFVVSIIPNPLFDQVGIAAGGTRYPLPRFLAVVLAGKLLKGVIVAYSCYHGIRLLPWVD